MIEDDAIGGGPAGQDAAPPDVLGDLGWYRDVARVAAPDLADDARLGDLGCGDDEEIVALLRRARVPRLRPVLVVLAARAGGAAEVDAEMQYMAELLHAALTVHDLALGRSGGRRRRLARRVLRTGMSWLGGNRVLLRAMELARHAPVPDVLDDLIDTMGAFQEARELSAALIEEGVPDLEQWSEHADGHTGALLAFCCRAGAHLGGAGPADVSALGRYGRHLGRLWHAAEDLVVLQGPQAEAHLVGRVTSGRPMLPVAVALARDPALGAVWRRVATTGGDPGDAQALLDGIHAARGLAGSRERVAQEHWLARQALSRLEATPHRHALERLASGLARAPFEDAPEAFAEPSSTR